MQRTTLYKHTRLLALAIVVVSMLAAGAAAGMIMKARDTQPAPRADYVGRFVVTPNDAQFVPPAGSQTR